MNPLFSKLLFISIIISFLSMACNRRHSTFTAVDIEEKTLEHKTIAILPFEIEMQGKMPKDWDETKKEEILESESEMFQRSVINRILQSSHKRKGDFRVSFQSIDKTRAILFENGLTHKTLKNQNPELIAQILGVDAIFKVKLRKHRYLSNNASMGINVGLNLLRQVSRIPDYVPGRVMRTNDINIDGTLIDGKNGEVLYSFYDRCGADWRQTPPAIVDYVNTRIAKKFPYRTK